MKGDCRRCIGGKAYKGHDGLCLNCQRILDRKRRKMPRKKKSSLAVVPTAPGPDMRNVEPISEMANNVTPAMLLQMHAKDVAARQNAIIITFDLGPDSEMLHLTSYQAGPMHNTALIAALERIKTSQLFGEMLGNLFGEDDQ